MPSANSYVKIYMYTLLLVLASLFSISYVSAGDLVIAGDQVYTLEDGTFTQKGNIYVKDNAKFIIRRATLNFEQDYHEQFSIWVSGNGELIAEDATVTSTYRFSVYISDNGHIYVSHSVMRNADGWGAYFNLVGYATLEAYNSLLDCISFESITSDHKATVTVQSCILGALALSFTKDSISTVKSLKTGLVSSLVMLKSQTGLPFDLTFNAVTIEREINCAIYDNAQVTFEDCEFHQTGPFVGTETCRIFFKSSRLLQPVLRFRDVATQLYDMKTGYVASYVIDLTGVGRYYFGFENTWIGPQGYYIRIHQGSEIEIHNSRINRLRPDGNSKLLVKNCYIEEMEFWNFDGEVTFEESTIESWRDTWNDPGFTNIFTMKGTVEILGGPIVQVGMGHLWGDSVVNREFPISWSRIPNAHLTLETKDGTTVWTGMTDDGGAASFWISFDKNNYQDTWKLIISKGGTSIERGVSILSSTPLSWPVPSVQTSTGSGTSTLDSDKGILTDLFAVDERSLSTVGKPNLAFPHGFFSFRIGGLSDGEVVTVTITLPSAVPIGTQYWKYGPTPDNPTDHWYQTPIGDDNGDNIVTITITDGGIGDDDLTANSVIIDQGGPGQPLRPVGGYLVSMDKIAILGPYLALAGLAGAAVTIVTVTKKKRD